MNRTLAMHVGLCLALSTGFAVAATISLPSLASAKTLKVAKKEVTITDRIGELSKKIDLGQKNNELTLDEATDLRKKITKINEKIDKCQSKNGGKLSYKDQNSVEKDLNKVSVKLLQEQLSKRTAKPSH